MEEDVKNMTKEELLEYLEDISLCLNNIALDQIQFAISELQFFKEEYKKLEEENKRCHKTISAMRIIKNTSRYEDTILMDEELCVRKNAYKIEVENGKFIDLNELYNVYKNSIPTSVIQEKIKELDKEKLKYDNDLRIYTLRNTFDFQKEVLQEILEEGRK